jgi:hypothetical protein
MNIETNIDGQPVTFRADFDGHWPSYITGQDLDYSRAPRKFAEELQKIDAAENAVQFWSVNDRVIVNGVEYKNLKIEVSFYSATDCIIGPRLFITADRHVELGDPNFSKLLGQKLTDAANKKLRDDHGQFFIDTAQAIVADLRQQCRQRFIDRTMEKITETREYLDDIAVLCGKERATS